MTAIVVGALLAVGLIVWLLRGRFFHAQDLGSVSAQWLHEYRGETNRYR